MLVPGRPRASFHCSRMAQSLPEAWLISLVPAVLPSGERDGPFAQPKIELPMLRRGAGGRRLGRGGCGRRRGFGERRGEVEGQESEKQGEERFHERIKSNRSGELVLEGRERFRYELGVMPKRRSKARRKTSVLLKPTEVATLSMLSRWEARRRSASLMRSCSTKWAGVLRKVRLKTRVK